ncbi:serine hydrolase domain-containing protein [Luteimonas sp. RIT-PG2_3]
MASASDLQAALSAAAAHADVAGAIVAISGPDASVHVATHGYLNTTSLAPVRPDSLFEIGSLTKVLVASIALQLVEEGLLDLDRPVRERVPDFRVADADASTSITLRQLLSHSSGIDGDFFKDTGDGPLALESYASACAGLEQLHAPGAGVSYCNAGYAIIGWLIERACMRPFDEVFDARIGTLLGDHSLRIERRGEQRRNRADGHIMDDGRLVPIARHLPPYAHAPAGARTSGRIHDVVRLARLHLSSDPRLLPTSQLRAMQSVHALPPPGDWECGARGLGWELFGPPERLLPGHDGATPGQAAMLRLVPDRGIVIAAAATGPGARTLFSALLRRLLPDEPGLFQSPPAAVPNVSIAPLLGRYACRARFIDIDQDADGLVLRSGPRNDPSGMIKPTSGRLWALDHSLALRRDGSASAPQPVVFSEFDGNGLAQAVHVGQRMHRRLPT